MKPQEFFSVDTLRVLGRPMAYYPIIAIALKDVESAVFLSQFMYWEGRQSDKEQGWIYKDQSEITSETGLSEKAQRRCRKYLKENLLLEECRKNIAFRSSPKSDIEYKSVLHYRFNWKNLEMVMNNNSEVKTRYINQCANFKKLSDQPTNLEDYFNPNQPTNLEVYSTIDQTPKLEVYFADQPPKLGVSTICITENTKYTENTNANSLFLEQTDKEKKEQNIFSIQKKNDEVEKMEVEKMNEVLNQRDIFSKNCEILIFLMLDAFSQRGTTSQKQRLESDLFRISKDLELTGDEMIIQFKAYLEYKEKRAELLHNKAETFISGEGFATDWVDKIKKLKIDKPNNKFSTSNSDGLADKIKAGKKDIPAAYFL